jgi:hypothetical protein
MMPRMLVDMDLNHFFEELERSAEYIAGKFGQKWNLPLKGVWQLEDGRLRLQLINTKKPSSLLRQRWSPVEAVWEVMKTPPYPLRTGRIRWSWYITTDRSWRLAMWHLGLSPWVAWRIVNAGNSDDGFCREFRALMMCATGLARTAAAAAADLGPAAELTANRALEMEARRDAGAKNWFLPTITEETLAQQLKVAAEVVRLSIPIVYRLRTHAVRAIWMLVADRLRLRITFPYGVWPWEWHRAKRATELRWSPLTALGLILGGENYPLKAERDIAKGLDLPPEFLALLTAVSEGAGMWNPSVRTFRAQLLEELGVPESFALELLPDLGV